MRIIFIICLGISFTLGCTKKNGENVIEFTVTPTKDFNLYGYDIKKLIKMKFGELEKVISSEAKVDSEVAVVFVRRVKDFVKKSKHTEDKDLIEVVYGPIEDTIIYNRYPEISPNTIYLSGSFSVQEDSIIKETIIKELKRNLPYNDTTKQIIWNIRKKTLFGKYDEDICLRIYFNMTGFQFAKFSICFFKYDEKHIEIFYKYIFSLKKDPYPGF